MEKLFDRDLLIARKLRAKRNPVDGSDFLMRRTAEDLTERLSVIERRFEHAITLFCATDHAEKVLRASGKVGRITRIEADIALMEGRDGLIEKREIVPADPECADLVVSLLSMHEINDVPGILAQIRRILRPDGLLLAAFSGAGTLSELRESLLAAETELAGGAAARVYPFMDVRDAGALLQRAEFALPVTDVETITARYSTLLDLMHDLRATGSTNALADRPRPLTRAVLLRASEHYANNHADPDGRLRATFSVIWISGWAPHASQQTPLKPGSATKSLGEALGEIDENRRSGGDD